MCALLPSCCLPGKLADTAAWAGEVPSDATACQALWRLLPVLRDLQRRAVSEVRTRQLPAHMDGSSWYDVGWLHVLNLPYEHATQWAVDETGEPA